MRGDQPEDIDDYSPMSGTAIAAFFLALFAPVGVFSPAIAMVFLVPIGLGLLSRIQIRRSAVPMKGGGLALAAISICLFCISASYAVHLMYRRHLSEQAQERFEEWAEYVKEGKLYEAHELHRQYTDRQLPGTDLEAIYSLEIRPEATQEEAEQLMNMMQTAEFTPKQEYDLFYSGPPISYFVEHAANTKFEFLRLESIKMRYPDTYIVLRYKMTFQDGGVQREMEILVEMTKSRYEGLEYHWAMFDFRHAPRST